MAISTKQPPRTLRRLRRVPDDQRMDKPLLVRMTAAQRPAFHAAAEHAGWSTGEWARRWLEFAARIGGMPDDLIDRLRAPLREIEDSGPQRRPPNGGAHDERDARR